MMLNDCTSNHGRETVKLVMASVRCCSVPPPPASTLSTVFALNKATPTPPLAQQSQLLCAQCQPKIFRYCRKHTCAPTPMLLQISGRSSAKVENGGFQIARSVRERMRTQEKGGGGGVLVHAVYAGPVPRGGVTRHGVVLSDVQSLLECQ